MRAPEIRAASATADDHRAMGLRFHVRSPADGDTRVFELLHAARPVLLNLDRAATFNLRPWADRVRLVNAEANPADAWELPVAGKVPAAAAVLLRPDGHVAWAGDLDDPDLPAALSHWFGEPAAPTA